jgi:(1->4)-alpha-D-glucan 1-alpha-D-glucosylmutase
MNTSVDARTAPPRRAAIIPRATYRLQLHHAFDFDAARAQLPYLRALGISHVYCSPISAARAGSLHGYDVVDPARINPELGGEAGFERFAAAARDEGLGLLIDLVPNHMGVFGRDNPWWLDVLENGPSSEYARYFDIAWRGHDSPNPALRGKLLVPLLGDPVGAVLERGELRVEFEPDSARLVLRYHEHLCPLDPSTYPLVLRCAPGGVFDGLADAFGTLPSRDTTEPALLDLRRTGTRALQRQLGELVAADAAKRAALDSAMGTLNDAPDRDGLDALHAAQAYRLAYWRLASGEINYRRFFDINDLAALRVEDERVFEATQGPALDLAARGLVDGLRIDHPDGLHDPAEYFERLQRGVERRLGAGSDGAAAHERAGPLPLYVVAEKIAAGYEDVPTRWALHGTTGYRFAMLLNGLFVERRSAAAMQRLWRDVDPSALDVEAMRFACKRAIAIGALRSELNVLGAALQRIAWADRSTRDYGLADLTDAVADVAASMPVYRTYVSERGVSAQDRRFIEWATGQARRRSELDDPSIYDFVQRCLLGGEPDSAMRAFAMRFQQFCAPVAAKGVEDTLFYRYFPLVSLNEVGADPAVFGVSVRAFHAANADRARRWPHTMLASSTHDSKRAEDVRYRIDVLSERPAVWRLEWRRWKRLARPLLTRPVRPDGEAMPSPADQFLLLQTLLGTLPLADASDWAMYETRIQAYMQKAVREAKRYTSWKRPDPDYEAALRSLVHGVIGDGRGAALAYLRPHAQWLAWYGALNSLSATVLKLTVPGVPDIYQGTELLDFSLVDPDNRRPVDYAARAALLTEFDALEAADAETRRSALAAMLQSLRGGDPGRLKLWLMRRLLACRRDDPALFAEGQYVALRVSGPRRAHAVVYARRNGPRTLVVIAARKFATVLAPDAPWAADAWTGTTSAWPAWLDSSARAHDVLGLGMPGDPARALDLGAALRVLPVAVWRFDQEV